MWFWGFCCTCCRTHIYINSKYLAPQPSCHIQVWSRNATSKDQLIVRLQFIIVVQQRKRSSSYAHAVRRPEMLQFQACACITLLLHHSSCKLLQGLRLLLQQGGGHQATSRPPPCSRCRCCSHKAARCDVSREKPAPYTTAAVTHLQARSDVLCYVHDH